MRVWHASECVLAVPFTLCVCSCGVGIRECCTPSPVQANPAGCARRRSSSRAAAGRGARSAQGRAGQRQRRKGEEGWRGGAGEGGAQLHTPAQHTHTHPLPPRQHACTAPTATHLALHAAIQVWTCLCVELEQQPAPGLRVRLRKGEGAGRDRHALPKGVACTVHGVRSVDRAAWIFSKVSEAWPGAGAAGSAGSTRGTSWLIRGCLRACLRASSGSTHHAGLLARSGASAVGAVSDPAGACFHCFPAAQTRSLVCNCNAPPGRVRHHAQASVTHICLGTALPVPNRSWRPRAVVSASPAVTPPSSRSRLQPTCSVPQGDRQALGADTSTQMQEQRRRPANRHQRAPQQQMQR